MKREQRRISKVFFAVLIAVLMFTRNFVFVPVTHAQGYFPCREDIKGILDDFYLLGSDSWIEEIFDEEPGIVIGYTIETSVAPQATIVNMVTNSLGVHIPSDLCSMH